MTAPSSQPAKAPRVLATMLPIVVVVFAAFLVTGLALPVLPLHIRHELGFGAFIVGIVAGAQFAAALLSRFCSGAYADRRGAKRAVVAGLVLAVTAGLAYLLSLRFLLAPSVSVAILLAGRAMLGAGESFVVTGALGWGLTLAGSQNAGRVMAWVGLSVFVAFAIGAPAGTALYGSLGFAAIALATMLLPLVTLLLIARVRPVAPLTGTRPAFTSVVGAVWLPGLGLALSSAGIASITTFLVLLFAHHGWGHAWLGLTLFAAAFVLGRLAFGHLPDRVGGARVALVSVLIEASGLALIWVAPAAAIALVGATVSGFGYALVYPGFGVEAVRRAPAQNHGLAMGTYSAFLDLALGLANPALGLVANRAGDSSVFLVAALVVILSASVAARLTAPRRAADGPAPRRSARLPRSRHLRGGRPRVRLRACEDTPPVAGAGDPRRRPSLQPLERALLFLRGCASGGWRLTRSGSVRGCLHTL